MKKILCAVTFLAMSIMFGLTVHAATYYVDAEKGSDSFTGQVPNVTGTDGPWKTLSKVAGTVLSPGDNVLLRCNQTWAETLTSKQSGSVGAPITFAAYGDACTAKPRITGRSTIPDYVWQEHSSGVWKVKFPLSLVPNGNLVNGTSAWRIWSSAKDTTIAADTSSCYSGKSAPCLTVNPGSTAGLLSSQVFSLESGASYTLTFSAYLAPSEMILKGNFISPFTGVGGWSAWASTKDIRILASSSSCLGGASAPCATVVTPTGGGLFSSPTFKVVKGETYQLKFSAYVPVGKNFKALVRQNFTPFAVLGFLSEAIPGASAWQDYTYTFTATASDPTARVDFEIPATSTVQFKNVSLQQPNRNTKALVRLNSGTFAPVGLVSPVISATSGWQDLTYTFTATESTPIARLDFEIPSNAVLQIKDAILNKNTEVTDIVQVFEDDLPSNQAHHPNRGFNSTSPNSLYFSANSTIPTVVKPNGRKGSAFLTTGTDFFLPAGAAIEAGQKIWIRSQNWSMKDHTITSTVPSGSNTLVYVDPATEYPLTYKGWGYFFTGALWMLDSPGEWFYDKASKTLYLSTINGAHPSSRIDFSILNQAADFDRKSYITVDGIDFHDAFNGLYTWRSVNFNLKNSTVKNTANYGVYSEGSTGLTIENCLFENNMTDAIQAFVSTGTTVKNTDIFNSGAIQDASGLTYSLPTASYGALNAGSGSVILNNRIVNASYNGIVVNSDSLIQNNGISNFCLVLSDCGGIYTGAAARVNIQNNIMLDGYRNKFGVPSVLAPIVNGIYLDGQSSNSNVSGNTVSNVDNTLSIHDSYLMTINSNTLYNARDSQIYIKENGNSLRADGNVYGISINTNNFFQTKEAEAIRLSGKVGDTTDFISSMDNNHYSALGSPIRVSESSPNLKRTYQFQDWQVASFGGVARNLDKNSSEDAPITSWALGSMGANLVTNGNLASGVITGWSKTGSTATMSVSACPEIGSNCLRFVPGTSTGNLISARFNVSKGTTYRVAFDAKFTGADRNLDIIVRRAGPTLYDNLMGNQSFVFTGGNTWKRYTFIFKAISDAIISSTDNGGRFEVQNVVAGETLSLTNLEVVPVTLAAGESRQDLLTNTGRETISVDCPVMTSNPGLCDNYYAFPSGDPVSWPLTLLPLQSLPVFTQDSSLPDSDADGISDGQDRCAATPAGKSVNAAGCPL